MHTICQRDPSAIWKFQTGTVLVAARCSPPDLGSYGSNTAPLNAYFTNINSFVQHANDKNANESVMFVATIPNHPIHEYMVIMLLLQM